MVPTFDLLRSSNAGTRVVPLGGGAKSTLVHLLLRPSVTCGHASSKWREPTVCPVRGVLYFYKLKNCMRARSTGLSFSPPSGGLCFPGIPTPGARSCFMSDCSCAPESDCRASTGALHWRARCTAPNPAWPSTAGLAPGPGPGRRSPRAQLRRELSQMCYMYQR